MNRQRLALDLDGTILDSRYRHQKVLYDCLRLCGQEVLFEDLNDFVNYKREGGNTVQYLSARKFSDIDKLNQLWKNKIEDKEYLGQDILYPGVPHALEYLRGRYKVFLATARRNKAHAHEQLGALGIANYFSGMYVAEPGEGAQHHKYRITKHLSLDYIVGDTEVDWAWAAELHVTFFALHCGFRSSEWWKKRQVLSYDSLHQLIENGFL